MTRIVLYGCHSRRFFNAIAEFFPVSGCFFLSKHSLLKNITYPGNKQWNHSETSDFKLKGDRGVSCMLCLPGDAGMLSAVSNVGAEEGKKALLGRRVFNSDS